ncbi:hypothetical protein E2C01_026116 [Portunus trituberculatus]|uniref:Uncharacterized protein n=1 Tax=Portunus trituberculatus TaxID=210409 RepID=A0A5B7EHI4_PORTR|nr:hypothetical protein [Portunus trituberculatus]
MKSIRGERYTLGAEGEVNCCFGLHPGIVISKSKDRQPDALASNMVYGIRSSSRKKTVYRFNKPKLEITYD